MMPERELPVNGGTTPLLEALYNHAVRYLVVGGFGVYFHDPTRDVVGHDLDLLFEPTTENAERLIAALTTLNVRLPTDAVSRLVAGTGPAGFPLRIWDMYADVFFDPKGDFAALWATSHEARIGWVTVRVLSAQAIIDRLATDTEPKHVDDVTRLNRVLGAQ
jgi:hypothetical protein